MDRRDEEAQGILEACLAGAQWDAADLRRLIASGDPALFRVVAEGLSDRFEPRLAAPYAAIFSEVIAAVLPEFRAADLAERFERIRAPRPIDRDPQTVYVLSRVTLGADIAITSAILDAAKRRFPTARIVFVGPAKNYELFSADRRIEHLPVAYGRAASLRDRIGICPSLDEPGAIVIDPDSRITQLGLLPVCVEDRYYFFDSRSAGGDTSATLGTLTREWIAHTFGIDDARAYLAPVEQPRETAEITVSLGVGGNAAKQVAAPFERELVAALAARAQVLIDAGAGGDEAQRVEQAAAGQPVAFWRGSFAGFASIIARSKLYIGYDSAGQHAAAASGVPLVTIFAGAPCDRFRQRWQPEGPAPTITIAADRRPPESILADVLAAIEAQ